MTKLLSPLSIRNGSLATASTDTAQRTITAKTQYNKKNIAIAPSIGHQFHNSAGKFWDIDPFQSDSLVHVPIGRMRGQYFCIIAGAMFSRSSLEEICTDFCNMN
jgi:hypothetical protein